MRKPILLSEAVSTGMSLAAIRWKEERGEWQRAAQGVYLVGTEPPTPVEAALATVIACGGVASGSLAGILMGLDAVTLKPPFAICPTEGSRRYGVSHRELDTSSIIEIEGIQCTNGLETMLDLAATCEDDTWEQALESALRKRLVAIDDFDVALKTRRRGNARIRRVLKRRPFGAPFTDSLLESLAIQAIRRDCRIPTPLRQVEVFDRYDRFVARVDLAWPDLGLFVELDGKFHRDQSEYDTSREAEILAL